MVEAPNVKCQQSAAVRQAEPQVWVLLEHSLENHALDHQRRAKGKLDNVAEDSGKRIVRVDAARERVHEQHEIERLDATEKGLEDRIIERPLSDRIADLQSLESHALCFFSDRNRIGNALQRHAAKADESIGMLLNDQLDRFVLLARKMR